jgi:homoserine dehydrogenase
MDVARKAVILARQCGLDLELGDVALEGLVPAPLRDAGSADEFLARLPEARNASGAGVAACGLLRDEAGSLDMRFTRCRGAARAVCPLVAGCLLA